MLDELRKSLTELGLSAKEAEVYISMLELGPASVQDIAKKAGVNRSTTYVMIEGLKRFGLISTFEKGKKVMFSAENPERLRAVITEQMNKLKDKDDQLSEALPQLQAIFTSWKDKPRVRYFEGEAAIHEIRDDLANMSEREEVLELFSVDEHFLELVKLTHEHRKNTVFKARSRALACIKPGFVQPFFQAGNLELRTLDYNKFPLTGSFTISKNRVLMYSMRTTGIGIIIESAELADFIRVIFEICWTQGQPWTPPEDWGPEKYLPKK